MTPQQTSRQNLRFLVVEAVGHSPPLAAALREMGDVQLASDTDNLAQSMQNRGFDAIAAAPDAFAALLHSAGRQQAEAILEHIGLGVCMVAADGHLLSANLKLRSYPDHAIEAVREACAKFFAPFAAEAPRRTGPQSRRTYVDVGGEFSFDVTASPMCEADGRVSTVVAIVSDTTAARRLRDKLNAIDAAGAELVSLDKGALAEMDVGERLQLLEDKIIRYTRDLMHFDHFCVRLLDQASGRLDTVLASGMSEEAKGLTIHATAEGNGISGYVAATGRSYIAADVANDSRYLRGIDNARSSLTVPLRLHDQVVGILNVESERIAAFSEDDRQFAEIFGRYVALALHILQLLVVERSATTGQIASDVSTELAGPLNDIVADATTLIEDYIGHDDLRHRLHAILDNVDRVKKTLAAMTDQSGITGLVPEGNDHDPVIGGKRILIADDEDIIRETIADLLGKCGAQVATARDGAEAIEVVKSNALDLVLSDIKMPHANGYEVFSAVKQTHPNCPVILITGFGYDPNHSIVRASHEGLAAVLFKPFKVEQLLEDVRHALTTNII